MADIVVIGGGIAGCAASLTAAKAGAKVTLLEKTDMLLGQALFAGLYKGNGRFTAEEELIAMGGGDTVLICDSINLHKIELPGEPVEKHCYIYDVTRIEQAIRKGLERFGIEVRTRARAKDVILKRGVLDAVILNDGETIRGDAFVEATGAQGSIEECTKYGFGCVMCHTRCPTFGSRVSISGKAGVPEHNWQRPDGRPGGIGAGFTLAKETLSPHIVAEIEEKGLSLIPIPPSIRDYEKFKSISATHNVRSEFKENLCLVDNGFAKVRVQLYMPLSDLHKIPGFERARLVEPISGGVGNAIGGLGMALTDAHMGVREVENLFCAGAKADYGGITESIISGAVAGYNAVRKTGGKEGLNLPETTAIGDFIAFNVERRKSDLWRSQRLSLRSSIYYQKMLEKGLYTTDKEEIKKRIEKVGLTNIMGQRIA